MIAMEPSDPQAVAASEKPWTRRRESDIKETIESILIAFILAFIFRAFVVEAFVIPTGSMAPTLLGAHMRFTCPDCGYKFEVNYPTDGDDDSMLVPKFARIERANEDPIDRVFAVNCPNCGYKLPRHDPADPNNGVSGPAVRYGDRILVLKYLYLFQDPRRWDVVVFKAPPNPIKDDYSVNYIKRLTGKPGESIMILDGDVYVAKSGSSGKMPSDFEIQTKPRDVQEALWRVVYDNDFHPQGLTREVRDEHGELTREQPAWSQPWRPMAGGRGWDLEGREGGEGSADPTHGRTFRFNAPDGSGTIAFDPSVEHGKFSLTDWLAYDQISSTSVFPADTFDTPEQAPPDNSVSDVKLAFTYRRESGEGPLNASLSKFDRTFIARIEPNRVTLQSRQNDQTSDVATSEVALGTGEHRIELTNVDYQVTLRVDGHDLIQTTPAQYAPNVPELLRMYAHHQASPKPTINIEASGQVCALTHIGLWRDNYYGNRLPPRSGLHTFHASPDHFPDNVAHLGADEFFVMGDNSPISLDARYWSDLIDLPAEELNVDAGRVPGRFLLGKAFFVYWPAGYRPIDAAPALVPDFGDMRIIH